MKETKFMGTLRVLDHTGDSETKWNPKSPVETKAAKARFDELLKTNPVAYKVAEDGSKKLTRSFDESATEIIMHPQLVGG